MDIEHIRGDTREITATFTDSDDVAINLTGGKVMFTVSASNDPDDDSAAVISKTISSFSTPTTGTLTITLSNSDTQTLDAGVYYYDIQLVTSGGVVVSQGKKKFKIVSDITRRIV